MKSQETNFNEFKQHGYLQMTRTLGIIYYLLALAQILNVRIKAKCLKTDFLYYYAKERDLFCSKQKHEVNIQNGQLSLNSIPPHKIDSEDMASGSSYGLYRPKSALARALYEKQHNDRYLQEFDQNEWYKVNSERLPQDVNAKFVQLYPDDETKKFLNDSIDKSSWVWTQIWYLLARAVLKYFWSITDINGWLGRGSMFVLSETHTQALLKAAPIAASNGSGSIVDVGAGDGEVSRRYSHLFAERYATEISGSMRKILAKKGYTLLDIDEWWLGQKFECVCMMNLLDRCSKPKSMLKQARAAIAPGGVLLLALVLPYKPYVEVTPDHKPEERLPIKGCCFEEQLASFVAFMQEEAGFELVSWSRAPYLCEGDFAQAYYWLDDSIYVFKPKVIESES